MSPELLNAAVAIAQERRKLLGRIRALLEAGKDQEAIVLVKQLCGMTNGEKSSGTHKSIN